MRPVRWLFPQAVWLVTARCELEQLLLLPLEGVNDIIGAWLARALEKYGDGIKLFAFVFLSNHLHLLLEDTKGQLPKFMWYFETNLAKSINSLLRRRNGRVFARRYDAELVVGEDEFLARYAYVVGNAVKAGLVQRAQDWIGLSSLESALSGEPMRFTLLDRTAYHNATRRHANVDRSKFIAKHEIRLATPPMWEVLSESARREHIEELVRGFEREQVSARRAAGKGFLGASRILAQQPTDRPRESTFAPRVYVLCRDRDARRETLAAWRSVTNAYRERFDGYRKAARLGRRFLMEWPPWTCPPGCTEPVGYGTAPTSDRVAA